MRGWTRLTAIVAPLPDTDIDTDQIIPAQFLRVTDRAGLGRHLFAGMRYRLDGGEDPRFVLNRAPYFGAQILVAYENFGCGSSREHAVWALHDFGIRCIVAPSFAEIFLGNCCRNAILPVRLARAACDLLIADALRDPTGLQPNVDLLANRVTRANGECFGFALDPAMRADLLTGADAIDRTLTDGEAIAAFERRHLPALAALPPLRFSGA